MRAISLLAHKSSNLRLDDRPLKASQNYLTLFKAEPDLSKMVDAFVETDNSLAAHQDTLIVNLPKMNGKMHQQYLPEHLGPDIAEQASSETENTSINTIQKTTPHEMTCSLGLFTVLQAKPDTTTSVYAETLFAGNAKLGLRGLRS